MIFDFIKCFLAHDLQISSMSHPCPRQALLLLIFKSANAAGFADGLSLVAGLSRARWSLPELDVNS